MKDATIVEVNSLTFYRGKKCIFQNLTCHFTRGYVYLLLGANGAGKTTLLRIFAGLLSPQEGSISLHGSCGYLGHSPGLYASLSVRENLELFSSLHRASYTVDEIDKAMRDWDIERYARTYVRLLSKGQMQRVALCRLWLQAPELFLIDEPTSSLDDGSVELFMKHCTSLVAHGQQRAIIVVTHDLARLGALSSRVSLLQGGELFTSQDHASLHEIVSRYQHANR
jgi:heme exporter protein A